MKARSLFVIAGLAAAVLANAQTFSVVPNGWENLNAGSTFLGPMANAQRTYQLLINENQLTDHVGKTIDGFVWRLPASATDPWPASDISFTNFDVRVSPGVTPSARSLTFASNVTGTQELVRSGALTVPAGSFPSGGSPNAWGMYIDFQTGYLYMGGHLLIEIRHTGFSGTSRSVDAIAATGGPAGVYGVLVSACWTGSYTGVSGSQGNFSAIQLRSVGSTTSVSGQIDFTDRVGNFPASVNIDFKNLDLTVAHTAMNVAVDSNGNYSTNDLPAMAGNYYVSVQRQPWLRRNVGPINTGSSQSGVDIALFNGDVDGDNEVGIGDLAILSGAFGSVVGDPNFDADADLDGDDEVGIGDYAILSGNFGMLGDD